MENNKSTNLRFLVYFLILTLSITLFISHLNKKREFKEEVFFIVDKIEVSRALRCYFYDKEGKKLELSSYTFYRSLKIKSGDIIVKKKNSKDLVIYRRDSLDGKEKVYLILNPR